MALTYGFYNSLNGDRKYSAKQFGSIFDGVIHDGIYSSIGNRMVVQASGTGFQVNIQTGRAWFNHTWTLNDTVYALQLPNPEPLLNKYVAVVLEVNEEQGQRRNSFKYVAGTPASSPVYPTLTNTSTVHQYPLAYCLVKAGATKITQAEITNMVGTSQCPYVTGVVSSFNVDELISQWQSQFEQWFYSSQNDFSTFMANSNTTFDSFMSNADDTYQAWWELFTNNAESWWETFSADAEDEFSDFMTDSRNEYNDFMFASNAAFVAFMNRVEPAFNDFIAAGQDEIDEMLEGLGSEFESFWTDFQSRMNTYLSNAQNTIETWFEHIQGQISEDAAVHLQAEIDAIKFIYVNQNRLVLPNTAASLSGSRLILSTP